MISFVNIWETKILDTIRTFLNNEFAGTIPVYTGNFKDMGSQSIRLNPVGSNLVDTLTTGEIKEYIIDVSYTFKEKTIKKDTWEHILRQVSHIETLFFQNRNNTFFDGNFVNFRVNELEEDEELIEGLNVMRWEWRGKYLGNIS